MAKPGWRSCRNEHETQEESDSLTVHILIVFVGFLFRLVLWILETDLDSDSDEKPVHKALSIGHIELCVYVHVCVLFSISLSLIQ